MGQVSEIEYLNLEKDEQLEKIINMVLEECFKTEKIEKTKLYVSVILTTPENIQKYNKKYRNIDSQTDVLSFPMFEKSEIPFLKEIKYREAIGDIIVSIERVKEQAIEYGHSFERELAYMIVHGFYHLMGEDHIEENDKKIMRQKEEIVLGSLNIIRN